MASKEDKTSASKTYRFPKQYFQQMGGYTRGGGGNKRGGYNQGYTQSYSQAGQLDDKSGQHDKPQKQAG